MPRASVDHTYRNVDRWTEMSILNVAGAGRFSSDRSVRDYAREIMEYCPSGTN
jgi:starch phosphorylase